MARMAATGQQVTLRVHVAGGAQTLPNGRVRLTMTDGGRTLRVTYGQATHQEATYMAALRCLRHADRKGVTHLTVDCPNDLLRGHMELGWRREAKNIRPLQEALAQLRDRFDQVDFA